MPPKKETYVKLKHEEHVLKLPDTYIGSIDKTTEELWYFDRTNNCMSKGNLTYIPGEFKIFDEIIVNAHDQYVRIKERLHNEPNLVPVKNIKVDYNKETGEISVYNDGEGIDVAEHPTEKDK